MNISYKRLFSQCVVFFSMALPSVAVLADAEVTRDANQNWHASVNGDHVYNGDRFFDAVNAAANSMSKGTINIRNSGSSGSDGGSVYAIRPKTGQTLDFHGHTVTANGGDFVVPVYCDRRDNITVRNLRVEGAPRYGVWFRGCSNVTLDNIIMELSKHSSVGLGIRVDASTAPAKNLTIKGKVVIDGAKGHGIETYGVNGFSIGDVTVTHNGGCGLILNNSRNGTVGNVRGEYNNMDGGYATFRVANKNGPNINVNSVYSRHSGRGFFSVSGSHGTTINYVDIADSTQQGVFLEDAKNTHVLSGIVNNGHPNCQLVRTSDSSIRVSGCKKVGKAPKDNVKNGKVDGNYIISAVSSNKVLGLKNCQLANGAGIVTSRSSNSECQQFTIKQSVGVWHVIEPARDSGLALDFKQNSKANGAEVVTSKNERVISQLFRFQSAGTGQWQIVNLQSNLCLDAAGKGNTLVQKACSSNRDSQKFKLEPI